MKQNVFWMAVGATLWMYTPLAACQTIAGSPGSQDQPARSSKIRCRTRWPHQCDVHEDQGDYRNANRHRPPPPAVPACFADRQLQNPRPALSAIGGEKVVVHHSVL